MAVHLAVAGDVFDDVLFCALSFLPQHVLDEIWDWIESVPENFPTYFWISWTESYYSKNS